MDSKMNWQHQGTKRRVDCMTVERFNKRQKPDPEAIDQVKMSRELSDANETSLLSAIAEREKVGLTPANMVLPRGTTVSDDGLWLISTDPRLKDKTFMWPLMKHHWLGPHAHGLPCPVWKHAGDHVGDEKTSIKWVLDGWNADPLESGDYPFPHTMVSPGVTRRQLEEAFAQNPEWLLSVPINPSWLILWSAIRWQLEEVIDFFLELCKNDFNRRLLVNLRNSHGVPVIRIIFDPYKENGYWSMEKALRIFHRLMPYLSCIRCKGAMVSLAESINGPAGSSLIDSFEPADWEKYACNAQCLM